MESEARFSPEEAYHESLKVRLGGALPEGLGFNYAKLADKKDQAGVENAFREYNEVRTLLGAESKGTSPLKSAVDLVAQTLLREKLERLS